MKKVNQNLKDSLLVLVAVTAGFLAVSGGGFADYAESKFWQITWAVLAWVGFFVFLGGWIYLKVKDSQYNSREYEEMKRKGEL